MPVPRSPSLAVPLIESPSTFPLKVIARMRSWSGSDHVISNSSASSRPSTWDADPPTGAWTVACASRAPASSAPLYQTETAELDELERALEDRAQDKMSRKKLAFQDYFRRHSKKSS